MALTALVAQANYTMASYSTMNTIPAADVESETPLLTGTLGFGTCMAAPTSPPTDAPPNPCGKPCTEDKDCNGNGGFFGNTCLVGGTRCAGHCAKRD